MATGTTSNFQLTRNQVIASALRKVKGMPSDGNPPAAKIREAITALNLVLRQEDLRGTGLSKHLWALDSKAIFLVVGGSIYTPPGNILEIHSVYVRDQNGGDTPLKLISTEAYAALSPKNEPGDPEQIYLERTRLLVDQRLFVWPISTSIGTTSEVVQDEVRYSCILKHTSASENKPGSGTSSDTYWQVKETAVGVANSWATATEYTNGTLLLISYKRPLFDFDSQYDNPDMPLGWENYIIYRLALALAPEYDLGADLRQLLRADLREIEAEIFPSARSNTNQLHNHTRFF
jgi:hypothetical protein